MQSISATMQPLIFSLSGPTRSIRDENQRLRRQVAELQAVVLRLQARNDALTAQLQHNDLLTVDQLTSEATASL